MFSRSFRRLTGGKVDVRPRAGDDLLQGRRREVPRQDPRRRSIATRSTPTVEFAAARPEGPGGARRARGPRAASCTSRSARRSSTPAPTTPSSPAPITPSPRSTTDEIDKQYETALVVDRGSYQLRLYKKLKLVKTYTSRPGHGRAWRRPPGEYKHPEQGGRPGLDASPTPTGCPAPSRARSFPAACPNNPLKARWMGIYDGVGDPRHRPVAYGSIGTNASHGCVRMRDRGRRGALRPGARRRPDLHRLGRALQEVVVDRRGRRGRRRPGARRPISSSGTSSQPRCSKEAWWSPCRMASVPMKTPFSCLRSTAYHMVEASPDALDAQPRARRQAGGLEPRPRRRAGRWVAT